MAENEFIGTEIPEDLLEAIAGGMTDLEKFNIDSFVYSCKNSRMSLDQALSKFSFLEGNENADEYFDYIIKYYNSI